MVRFLSLLVACLPLVAHVHVHACTTILVGKKATVDGKQHAQALAHAQQYTGCDAMRCDAMRCDAPMHVRQQHNARRFRYSSWKVTTAGNRDTRMRTCCICAPDHVAVHVSLDNLINVKVVRQCLLKRGFETITVAENGQIALDVIEQRWRQQEVQGGWHEAKPWTCTHVMEANSAPCVCCPMYV